MSFIEIVLLIFAIFSACKAQTECNQEMCDNMCKGWNMAGGNCNGNECDCSYGKNCSAMVDLVCDKACEVLKLKGECENDQCICEAELKGCWPWECEEQCEDDIRAKECEASWGIVIPIWCVEYGPARGCGCLCQHWAKPGSKSSFVSMKAKKLTPRHRYHYEIST